MRVRVSVDSTQFGNAHCEKCHRLWLAFGQINTTRLSLLSTMSIEPPPVESEFRAALIHIIRAATPVAALSPTLTAIPEAASSVPSRETSVSSTTRVGLHRPSTATGNELGSTPLGLIASTSGLRNANTPHTEHRRTQKSKRFGAKGSHFLQHIKQRIISKLPNRGLWFIRKRNSTPEQHQEAHETLRPNVLPPSVHSTTCDDSTSSSVTLEAGTAANPPNICDGASTSADALASLKALDPHLLQPLPAHQLFEWGREQITKFKALPDCLTNQPAMVDSETQISIPDYLHLTLDPYSQRRSSLAYIGGWLGSNEYLDSIHGSNATIAVRPLSISETRFSEAETIAETIRGSREHRPHSLNLAMQANWNRAEGRRSIESTTTGGLVRSMATGRGRADNRLSRTSWNQTSSVSDTEPPTTRQVRFEDVSEPEDDREHHNSPPESPRTPFTTA
ncbi:hypothetical protein HRS9139_05098 [Pyrenophora teres f. teres]|nr:hypothetical protein HRS9139_05098 [Pyrenophora teres f. teres]KAE8848912.1 hypothetical protein HRS9122_02928 [Pyrenophora teres f. teres]